MTDQNGVEHKIPVAGKILVEDKGFGLIEASLPTHWTASRDELAAAIGEVVDDAFGSADTSIITWLARLDDEVAWRAAWSHGFAHEGTRRDALVDSGERYDAWAATLRRDDTREPKTPWIDVPRLVASGLVLRLAVAADRARFLETMADEVTNQWLASIPLPRTSESFDAMVQKAHIAPSLGHAFTWTIADEATDEYLGSLSMFDFEGLDYQSAEVGYRTHPDARGRGVVPTALGMAIAHSFTPSNDGGFGLERLRLGAADSNVGSRRVAEKCGFTEVGRDRRCYDLPDGSIADLVRYDLLVAEWRP